MTVNSNAFFEASIGRKDPLNLKSNIVKESFFDTGKGRTTDEYEETTHDGTTLFKDKTKTIGSAMFESSYEHTPTSNEFDKHGGVETYTDTSEMTSKTLAVGVPDIIEHKDQLLGEIHKIKGFENVTIEDVVQGKTGLDENTLFNILANSDASFATAAKQEKANKEDLESRGIKSGEGFSMSAGDEIGKSLEGTTGYRIGQINPLTKVMSSSNYTDTSKKTYDSTGLVKPDSQESDMFNNIAASINQSVGQSGGTTTVIQPVVNNVQVPVSVPQPFPVPVKGKTKIITTDSSKINNLLAKSIK